MTHLFTILLTTYEVCLGAGNKCTLSILHNTILHSNSLEQEGMMEESVPEAKFCPRLKICQAEPLPN